MSFFGQVKTFGVAFIRFQPRWHHAAIIFSDDQTHELRLLHLGGHYDFANDAYTPDYLMIPCPGFDDDELDLLAALAQKMWTKNGKQVPYNFDYDGSGAFDHDLSFLSEGGKGLTCATFVLAFFVRYGMPIIDAASWDVRPGDAEWQLLIYNHFKAKLSAEHADRMFASIGNAARFLPEEVVACASRYTGKEIDFPHGAQYGVDFMDELLNPSLGIKA